MAQRYGMLPSEVLSKATTLDLKAMDIAVNWEVYQRVLHETGRPPAPKMNQDQMQALMNKVKNK